MIVVCSKRKCNGLFDRQAILSLPGTLKTSFCVVPLLLFTVRILDTNLSKPCFMVKHLTCSVRLLLAGVHDQPYAGRAVAQRDRSSDGRSPESSQDTVRSTGLCQGQSCKRIHVHVGIPEQVVTDMSRHYTSCKNVHNKVFKFVLSWHAVQVCRGHHSWH